MTVDINVGEVQETLRGIQKELVDRKLFNKIGFFIRQRIDTRTAKGVDVDGAAFKKYSPQYKLFRRAEGHPVSKVNLFFSGSMMSSMTHSVSGETIKVFFTNTKDAAGTSNPLKAFYLNKTRRFFAMSEEDMDKIFDMVEDSIEEALEG